MLARLQVSQMFSIVILQEGKEFLDRLQRMDNFESQDFDNVASSPPQILPGCHIDAGLMMTLQ